MRALILASLFAAGLVHADPIGDAVKGLDKRAGLATLYADTANEKVLLELGRPDARGVYGEWIYQTWLRDGLGSTPVGLDRSQPGPTQLVKLFRVGKRVLFAYENTAFRAEDPAAARAVKQSFPDSVVFAADIKAENPDGSVLIDIGPFLTRDAAGVIPALKGADAGAYRLDANLSYPDAASARAFPDNLEIDADLTLVSEEPGAEPKRILADPTHFTLAEHHSFVRLPPPGFKPLAYDPRVNGIDVDFGDFGAPLRGEVSRRLAVRFRLEKTDPTAAVSPVKKPIVFYVDPAAPADVREALKTGAAWWSQAFAAAGYKDAFRTEILPEGADPLDARYNVINWVHRQTRGWSYGFPLADPRTGEIIRGAVLLGSWRMRQDRMIFEGLVGAEATGKGGTDDPALVTLARLRQLAAHETGHAIGFAHNFAASTYADRASVMDYPPPRVKLTDGKIDLSDAYKTGLGDWDLFAVQWLYGAPPPGVDEAVWRENLIREARAKGMRFVADDDARPVSSPHPKGALWDDGADPVAALETAMRVRRLALDRFGTGNLPDGAADAELRRAIVPIYLFHRYEVEAAAKLIGGVDFEYAVKGDGREAATPVSGAEQTRALNAILGTVKPEALDLPERVLAQMSNGQSGVADRPFEVETFGGGASPVFDLPTAADAAADIAYSAVLAPARLNRLADQAARDPATPGVGAVARTMIAAVFAEGAAGHAAELRRRAQARLVIDLETARRNPALSPSAAAELAEAMKGLSETLKTSKAADPDDRALHHDLALMLSEPSRLDARIAADKARNPRVPPGMPIGD